MTESTGDTSNVIPMDARKGERNEAQFFAIDRRAWAHVCKLGLNPAIAYLVLALGTGHDNRTTKWSVNAIEGKTGIGRPRAKAAVALLETKGFIRKLKGGKFPQYFMQPAHEIPGCEGNAGELERAEKEMLAVIGEHQEGRHVPKRIARNDRIWPTFNPYDMATRLASRGFLHDLGGQFFKVADMTNADQPQWTWLPAELITGAGDEIPPIERIRQTRSLGALRMLIDLYHLHDLPGSGGIEWRPGKGFRMEYERHTIAESGPFIVWGFSRLTSRVWKTSGVWRQHCDESLPDPAAPFWEAFKTLERFGLLEIVQHVVEADSADGEVLHPAPFQTGEPQEREVWQAAYEASKAMATSSQMDWAMKQRCEVFSPVLAHIKEVQCIGVIRLRYRPKTSATKAWLANVNEWANWARKYAEMTEHANEIREHAISRDIKGHQGGSKYPYPQ